MKTTKPTRIDLTTLAKQVVNGEVGSVTIKESSLEVVLKDKKEEIATKESGESFTQLMKNLGVADDKLSAIELKVRRESLSCGLELSSRLPPYCRHPHHRLYHDAFGPGAKHARHVVWPIRRT